MSVDQDRFHRALRDPDQPIPEGLVGPSNHSAGRRFNVYRNNVTSSLIEAMTQAYPVIHKLLGDVNFRNLARDYQAAHPPSSPLMMFFGEHFPSFLKTCEPLAKYPYLADVARLEFALRRTYHAADAAPLDWGRVADLTEDQLLDYRFRLAPAVQVLASPWPIFSIWQFNMKDGAPKPVAGAQTVLIARPEFDPVIEVITPADAGLIDAFAAGQTLRQSLAAAQTVDASHDFGRILGRLLALNALAET